MCGNLGEVSTFAAHSESGAFGSRTTFICDFKKPELGLDIGWLILYKPLLMYERGASETKPLKLLQSYACLVPSTQSHNLMRFICNILYSVKVVVSGLDHTT